MLVYKGIQAERGNVVPADDALVYAMARCGIQVAPGSELDQNFAGFFEEWFYSGDWIREGEEE